MTSQTASRAATEDSKLIALLDAPAPASRSHRFTTRPPAAQLSGEAREAIRVCDALSEKLTKVTAELAQLEDPATKAAAAKADSDAVIANAINRADGSPTNEVADLAERATILRTELTTLSKALAAHEDQVCDAIREAWTDGPITDQLRRACAPGVKRYEQALADLSAADRELAEVWAKSRWWSDAVVYSANRGRPSPSLLRPSVEFRKETDYSIDVLDTVGQTIAVRPTLDQVAEVLRGRLSPYRDPQLVWP